MYEAKTEEQVVSEYQETVDILKDYGISERIVRNSTEGNLYFD